MPVIALLIGAVLAAADQLVKMLIRSSSDHFYAFILHSVS